MEESFNIPGKLVFFGVVDKGNCLKNCERIFSEEFNILQDHRLFKIIIVNM
jgi:hypothetical protein